ncbi:hypothetical protein O1Q96_31095 [Streptomyces sp. Qhu-G9]|uniref:hypothetical protein n=1 Tax=Streptomyces sp. Qhu-G9 TaxID=3452799 RepID=UPI0022AC33B6|nr:hypothetical protein [Streptomyces aurantiacus]WAU83749.1 hypothetical protein O1Q96_31095 [Streptomyces aurantiacus]
MSPNDPVWFTFLNGSDIEPRVRLTPHTTFTGHFDVLHGHVGPHGLTDGAQKRGLGRKLRFS